MSEADQLIARLKLEPLFPEGGYYRRTWTGASTDPAGCAGTAIYFLLTPETFSAFHRLRADEIWHFYAGAPVEHWQPNRSAPPAPDRKETGPDESLFLIS